MEDISEEKKRHKSDDTVDLTQLICTDSFKSISEESLLMLWLSVSVTFKTTMLVLVHMSWMMFQMSGSNG